MFSMRLLTAACCFGALLLTGCGDKKCSEYSATDCSKYDQCKVGSTCSVISCALNADKTACTPDNTNCKFTAASGTTAASCASAATTCEYINPTCCANGAACKTTGTTDAGCNAPVNSCVTK